MLNCHTGAVIIFSEKLRNLNFLHIFSIRRQKKKKKEKRQASAWPTIKNGRKKKGSKCKEIKDFF